LNHDFQCGGSRSFAIASASLIPRSAQASISPICLCHHHKIIDGDLRAAVATDVLPSVRSSTLHLALGAMLFLAVGSALFICRLEVRAHATTNLPCALVGLTSCGQHAAREEEEEESSQ